MDQCQTESYTPEYLESVGQYCEGGAAGIESIEIVSGWGARLSAPGYLDCTEWSVYETEEEARADLAEMYGDDDEGAE